MKIFIDIGHPAHVHYYKNFIIIMKERGHEVLVTARDREVIHTLLEAENISYLNRGKGAGSWLGKIFYALKADIQLLWHALKFKPDIFLSHGSHYALHVSKIIGKPCISTGDSDHIKINAKFLMPYLACLLTPSVYRVNYGEDHLFFKAYMELLYLHPNYFTYDNSDINSVLDLKEDERYFVLRFITWNAFHDEGQGGISTETKFKLIDLLSDYGKVVISSEGDLPKRLKEYEADFPPEMLHAILAEADLCISEGATTASEAAILGTPTIYVNSLEVSYCKEQEEKYFLCYSLRNDEDLIKKVNELLIANNLKEQHQSRREEMLNDKIDVTAFLVWFIENYPESKQVMKENPEYQYNFS